MARPDYLVNNSETDEDAENPLYEHLKQELGAL